jgi:hypothetical protein
LKNGQQAEKGIVPVREFIGDSAGLPVPGKPEHNAGGPS